MVKKANPDIKKEMIQRLQEITNHLKAAGYKEHDINKVIKNTSHKVFVEISKEIKREQFAKIKAENN